MLDLRSAPPSNAFLDDVSLHHPEIWYPLRVFVCEHCWLVQTEDFAHADQLFSSEYAYFSGFSTTWVDHCRHYVDQVTGRFQLDSTSQVVEVAANDGTLLQFFLQEGIPCVGIEPTASTAAAAKSKGIPIIEEFFGAKTARQLVEKQGRADLVVANNVLAHVPDINDFMKGVAILLKTEGVATFEFPHILHTLEENQFDTIYHEHFSYLSLATAQRIVETLGLSIFDVQELPTHGGSLRVFVQPQGSGMRPVSSQVQAVLLAEQARGLNTWAAYAGFQSSTDKAKNAFLEFLLKARAEGKKVAAYGAAAKGNTFLNYAGVRSDLVSFVVDKNPAKQGKYLPGSRIPVVGEAKICEQEPDFVVVLPWNLITEIRQQLSYIRDWGGKFVTAIPSLTIHP